MAKRDERMEQKQLVCIICPNSCELTVRDGVVSGQRCKRGGEFARQELVAPLRVITTTIRCRVDGRLTVVPVKTALPVPLAECKAVISAVKALILDERPGHGTVLPVKCPGQRIDLIVTG